MRFVHHLKRMNTSLRPKPSVDPQTLLKAMGCVERERWSIRPFANRVDFPIV